VVPVVARAARALSRRVVVAPMASPWTCPGQLLLPQERLGESRVLVPKELGP
jgi:hypothetical protein